MAELTDTNGKKLSEADLIALPSEGYAFSQTEISRLSSGGEMLVMEAKVANATIELSVEYEGAQVYTYTVPLSISSVTNMYRYLNLRSAVGDAGGEPSCLLSPWNRPDEECDGRHFVFVHGYNVDSVGSRNWANQMFKRLRLSGSKARFHGIAWYGDYRIGEDMNPVEKMNAFFYHRDVYNALQTASSFKTYVEKCQLNASLRIVMAHSLGNMVASESLRLGLNVAKYFMFNAAVASEAYDATLMMARLMFGYFDNMWKSIAPPPTNGST